MKRSLLAMLTITFLLLLAACGTSEESGSGNAENSENSESSENSEENNGGEQSLFKELQEEGATVATSGTLYPASYYPQDSDKLTGYDVEIMKEIGKRLDIDITFEELGVDGMLPALQNGRVDMVINDFDITEERKEKFAFSEPYKYSYSTMIVREEDLSGIESLEDVEGKVHGGGATTLHSQNAKKLGAELKTYNNPTNDVYLRDVANGRTDFIINDYYLQSLALKALPEIPVKLHPDIQFNPNSSGIVLPKGADELQEKVNEALGNMRDEGVLTELAKEFFGGKDASVKPDKDIRTIDDLK